VVALACQRKVTRGRKLRTDATVVETNIPHPTDSALLSDGVRVLSRLLGRAKGVLEGTGELLRNRTRSAKRLARRIEQGARRRGGEAKEALKGAYERLIGVAKASLKQAQKVRRMLLPEEQHGLAGGLERFEGLVERVVDQTERRVLKGESVKAAEKLVSIFEEHTSIIRRGKAGKETEYGHKVWLQETEGGIISGYRVLEGNPADRDQLLPALKRHEERFGKPPRLVAADRGVYSPENERECRERGVERVCLPKPGKKSEKRREYERQGWFSGGGCASGRGSRGASERVQAPRIPGPMPGERRGGLRQVGRVGGFGLQPAGHSTCGGCTMRAETEEGERSDGQSLPLPISHHKLASAIADCPLTLSAYWRCLLVFEKTTRAAMARACPAPRRALC
jgi:hypothetical protein